MIKSKVSPHHFTFFLYLLLMKLSFLLLSICLCTYHFTFTHSSSSFWLSKLSLEISSFAFFNTRYNWIYLSILCIQCFHLYFIGHSCNYSTIFSKSAQQRTMKMQDISKRGWWNKRTKSIKGGNWKSEIMHRVL